MPHPVGPAAALPWLPPSSGKYPRGVLHGPALHPQGVLGKECWSAGCGWRAARCRPDQERRRGGRPATRWSGSEVPAAEVPAPEIAAEVAPADIAAAAA